MECLNNIQKYTYLKTELYKTQLHASFLGPPAPTQHCPSQWLQYSENENIHKEMYIITTGNLPPPCNGKIMQPTQNSIGQSIRIGREILCLPNAGLFLFYLEQYKN